ncbi:hypothetical protein CI109_100215 [Kwoniella shandongensis]|uniref:WD repeat-containing protein 75 second beta-propeller domain-containing protein n=1 Tax=Kwoniella shandongensis TaxID=1734106 RepID=A0A5M6BRC4_9TREE|nr:uncharacterized protein CI109_006250 [Kwoniella shandongensis]KAA5525446.1 hypothetical protein CI109_006250 [Kwoniella shandongensis]
MAEKNGSSSSTPMRMGRNDRRKSAAAGQTPKSTSSPLIVNGHGAATPVGAETPSRVTPKGKEKAVDLPVIPNPTGETPRKRKDRKREKALSQNINVQAESSTTGALGGSSTHHRPKRKIDSSQLWDSIPVAQNEVSRIPPVWSNDGRFYFTVAHNSIHIHSSTAPSFHRLSTLSSTHPDGHQKPITSLHLSPLNPFQILTSSEDGTVKLWDWVEGRLVRTIEFKDNDAQVRHICFGEVLGKWCLFAAITSAKSGSSHKVQHRLVRVRLTGASPGPFVIGKLSAPPVALMMSPRSTYLVALAGNKAYTYRMPSPTKLTSDVWTIQPTCVKLVADQPFTCGAFCPEKTLATASEEEWFATGDQKGAIRLWHGLAQAFRQVDLAAQAAYGGATDSSKAAPETEKRLPTTTLHWHAHAVSAIAFTPSGSQLLSVGEESVLVQWHLASGKREYIPRLGGRPIISLAVRRGGRGGEEEWWMSLADGSVIRVGASSGHISNVGQGIRLDPLRPASADTAYPISLHPATQALVVPSSHPSTLQFIDPIASTVLFDLEVAPSNRVSRRDEKQLQPVAVEKVAFSEVQDGQSVWMVTMEGRNGDDMEGGGMVKNLKMWKWIDEKYIVNTQFPRPHGTANLTSVTFSPNTLPSSTSSKSSMISNPYLLTTSTDGVAKLWHVRQSKKSEQGKVSSKRPAVIELYWSCRSTFDYRNMPILNASFSPDATIVALAHGSVVTLWDVESNILLKVLDSGSSADVQKVGFVGSEGRFLAGAGADKGVIVWDLLSCDIAWATPSTHVQSLLVSPSAPFFITTAVEDGHTKLSVFDTVSSKPLRIMHTSHSTKQIKLLPNSSGVESVFQLHLVGIAPSGEIYRFGDVAASAAPLGAKSVTNGSAAGKGLSIWQEMFGKDAFLEEIEPAETSTATASALQQRIVASSGRPADVFEGPSHTMPPVGMLFDAFMDELLSGRTASRSVDMEENDDVNDGNDILYEDEARLDIPALATEKVKGHVVDDMEMAELEAFFKQVLSTAPKPTPATPAVRKPNGVHLPNGVDPRGTPRNFTPITKKVNGVNGLSSASKHDEEDDDRELDTPQSGKKGKGKKRKAPREE